MAAKRERRTALWPYLVMPLIVLIAFYVLCKVHQRPGPLGPPQPNATVTGSGSG
jgi:hypothetical protein